MRLCTCVKAIAPVCACASAQLQSVQTKMMAHAGDRSHPKLVKLDGVAAGLSYEGFEADVARLERIVLENKASSGREFEDGLAALSRKQMLHVGSGDEKVQTILLLKQGKVQWPGWHADIAELENYFVNYPVLFPGKVSARQPPAHALLHAQRLCAHAR